MKIDRLDCCIRVDNEPLPEYDVKLSEDEETCTAWIPCKAGQNFKISWMDNKRKRETSTTVLIDGNFCGKFVLQKSRTSNTSTKGHVRVSSTESRPFQFAVLELTDDEALLARPTGENIGEIRVEIWRAKVLGVGDILRGCDVREPSRVHEKTKKGLAHSVKFGEAKRSAPKRGVDVERRGDRPIATFIFHYRSMDLLRANGIVAQPASSTATRSISPEAGGATSGRQGKRKASNPEEHLPVRKKVKAEVVDLEEIEEIESRVRQAEEDLRRARLQMYRQRGNVRVEAEDVSTFLPGEVIDLTED